MSKKLIALLEVLMVVSLFCTGFASWSVIVDQPDSFLTVSSEAYEVEGLALRQYGMTLMSEADGLRSTSFEYVETQIAGGNKVYQATSSTLSMLLRVDPNVMAANETDYRQQILLLTCSVKDENNALRSFKPQDANNGNQSGVSGYYKAPRFCKLTLNDYPNRYIMVDLSNNFDEQGKINTDILTVEIPLTQLYNLVKDYMVKDENGTLKTPIVIAELEFEPNDTRIDIPCKWIYTFSARIK